MKEQSIPSPATAVSDRLMVVAALASLGFIGLVSYGTLFVNLH